MYKVWLLFPYRIRNKFDILRRRPLWKKYNAIFIHVPKAAGVSVNRAIYGRPLGHFFARDIKKLCPKTFEQAYTFSVVRHPIERLYSAYRFSRKGGTNVMGMKNPTFYISHPNFVTFESFVKRWLLKQNLNKIDGVFRPQFLYLFDDDDNLLVDQFYHLEDIENHFNEISQKIGKEFVLGYANQSEKDELNVSEEIKQIIFKLYRKDFELLGYSL